MSLKELFGMIFYLLRLVYTLFNQTNFKAPKEKKHISHFINLQLLILPRSCHNDHQIILGEKLPLIKLFIINILQFRVCSDNSDFVTLVKRKI